MFDNISKEQVAKIKSTVRFINRFLSKLLTFALFAQYVYFFPMWLTRNVNNGYYAEKPYVIVGVILSFLIFYSATRFSTVYHDAMAKRFIESEEPIDSLKKRLRFIFSQKENQAEFIAFGVIYLILPPKLLHAGFVWLFANGESGLLAKLKVLGVTLPILLIIYLLSNLSAMNYWNNEGRKKIEDMKNMGPGERAEQAKSERRDKIQFEITLFISYYVGSMAIMFLIPALFISLSPLLLLFLDLRVLALIVLLTFLPWIYRNIRALIKRRIFITALTKLCREKKYKLSKIKAPYKSLFKPQEGESFSVYINKRRYSCKLATAKKRTLPLYILPNGTGSFLIKVRFIRLVLFSYTKSFNFNYEAEGKKVLIVNPVPQRILLPYAELDEDSDESSGILSKAGGRFYVMNSPRTKVSRELDNGDIVGEFEIYSARAFLNALERDCIDKD